LGDSDGQAIDPYGVHWLIGHEAEGDEHDAHGERLRSRPCAFATGCG
jgi:hypothetical protein